MDSLSDRKYHRKNTFGVTFNCGPTSKDGGETSDGKKKCDKDEYEGDPNDPFCKGPFICMERLKFPESVIKIEGCRDYFPLMVKSCAKDGHPCDGQPCCDDDDYVREMAEKKQFCPNALCVHVIRHPVNSEKDEDDECKEKKYERPIPYCNPCLNKKKKRKPPPSDDDDDDDPCD